MDQHKNFIRKVSRGVSFYDVGKGINGVTCENAKPILIIIHYRIGNNFAEHSAKGWRDDDDLNWFQKWDFALLNVHCRLRQTAKGKSFFFVLVADVIIALSEHSRNPLQVFK